MKEKEKDSARRNINDDPQLKKDAAYPKLAKRGSDGMYCYFIQRRISLHISRFCVRKGITANAATGIDMVLAILAALSLSQGHYLLGVVLVQLFGLWSCVDGEVARLTESPSNLGDFYDTMTDRSAEFLISAGIFYSMPVDAIELSWGTLFFCYMGMVFLITASSEKFRSVYHRNYPKSEHEGAFNWLCAGSDTRLLYLSLATLAYSITGRASIVAWVTGALAILLGVNFLFRMWKISSLSLATQVSRNRTPK